MSGCSSKIQRWTCGHGSKYTVRPRSQEHQTVSEHLLIGYPIWESLRSQHLLPWHVKRSQAIGVIEDDFGSSESTLASLALLFAKGLLQITPHQWYKVLQEFITYLRDSACVRWSLNMFAFVFNIERAVSQNIPIATGTHRPGLEVVKIVSGYGGKCRAYAEWTHQWMHVWNEWTLKEWVYWFELIWNDSSWNYMKWSNLTWNGLSWVDMN